jgi:hypothetical protein
LTDDINEIFASLEMFDRETRRTRLLENRSRLKHDRQLPTVSTRTDDQPLSDLQQATEHFWSIIAEEKRRLQQQTQRSVHPFTVEHTSIRSP